VFLGDTKYPDLYIRRIDWTNVASWLQPHIQGSHLPVVIVVGLAQNALDW
jgi:hypothetical protein